MMSLKQTNAWRWWVLAVAVAGQFMFVVDAFIVNVAIPTIRNDLHATASEIEAVIAVYQIAFASMVITGGRLGDLYGRRRLFIIGVLGFAATSCWCGLAGTGSELVLARMLQGAAGGLMVPQVLAMVHVLFPDQARARAFAIYGITLGLGGAAGFILGGILISVDPVGLGWRSVFLVNLPVGLILAVAACMVMPAARRPSDARLDVSGAALLFATLVLLIGSVLAGPGFGWSGWILGTGAVGAAGLWAFGVLERRIAADGGQPLVDPALLGDAAFRRGLFAAFSFQFGNIAFYLVITLFMQGRLGFSAWRSGLAVVPLGLVFPLASQLAGWWTPRWGVSVLRLGCLIQLAAAAILGCMLTALPTPGFALLASVLAIFGFGQGLVMAPLSGVVLATVRPEQAGAGSGILNTVNQAAGACGIAVVGAVFLYDGLVAALAVLALAYAVTWQLLRPASQHRHGTEAAGNRSVAGATRR